MNFKMISFSLILLLLSICLSCPSIGNWEETPEGQVASISCNLFFGVTYYEGFVTRLCSGSTIDDWGMVLNNCTFIKPIQVSYPSGVT